MPIVLMHAVSLALAATVTLWIAPISFGSKGAPAGEIPAQSPLRTQRSQKLGGLHVRHEMFE